ncbi:M12 family metallo-peptidase [Hyphobacterium sp.]|uniref:M12 family metallo-peptidase n=1 Tax=Hyphobacterium sp. TaxID=2004662 RepID=UPI003BABA4A0
MRLFSTALALTTVLAGGALAQDMFTNVQTLSADGGDRDRIVFDGLSNDVMEMQPGETIGLNFGPGYTAELDEIRYQEMGGRVWAGRLEGQSIASRVLLTETNGEVFGRISTPDGLWQVVSLNGHQEIIRVPDLSTRYRVNDTVIYTPPSPEYFNNPASPLPPMASIPIAEMVPVGSNGTIDIAVYYSQSFSALWGMASGGRVQHLMAVLDQALIDSDTGLRARLVFHDVVNLTDDNADQAQTLANISGVTDNEAPTITQDLSAQRAVRTTHGADLVAVLQRTQNGHGGCGIASLLGSLEGGGQNAGDINASWANRGFSVSGDWFQAGGDGFCSDITFAHEIGHNMGFAHNVEDSGVGTGVRNYANGHRVDCEFLTIMAYPTNPQNPQSASTCPQGASRTIGNEQEIAYFSNPALNLCPGGVACGIAAPGGDFSAPSMDNQDPADNARAAREESLDIVAFQAEAPRVVSSVLPITRSVQNGTPATAFATLINPAVSQSTATQCRLRLGGATAGQFSYQTTTAANALTGTANTPIDIPAGGVQNFVFSVTSAGDFNDNVGLGQASANDETNLFIEAFCTNRRSSEFILGLNTLTFTSSATAVPDIIALATSGDPGRVNVPTTGNRVGVFAVAISNVGAAGTIDVAADTGTRNLAIQNIEVCPTDPNTGACTQARAATAQVNVGANGTATFGVFVRGTGAAIANDPARNRVFVRFTEGGVARGATSVAVRTQ